MSMLNDIKDIATIAGVLAAGIWFFRRWEFGARLQLSLDWTLFLQQHSEEVLAELRIIMKNVGFVKQQILNYHVVVNGMEGSHEAEADGGLLDFPIVLLDTSNLELSDRRNNSIRAGVEYIVSIPIRFKTSGPLIKVTTTVQFNAANRALRSVSRVFEIRPKPTT